jgi:hypothetical protein
MKLPHRTQVLHLATGAAASPLVSRIARAQAYPSRPVRIIVTTARDRQWICTVDCTASGFRNALVSHSSWKTGREGLPETAGEWCRMSELQLMIFGALCRLCPRQPAQYCMLDRRNIELVRELPAGHAEVRIFSGSAHAIGRRAP